MKRLIPAIILATAAVTAQANENSGLWGWIKEHSCGGKIRCTEETAVSTTNFQKVYQLPGMSAAQIEKAFGAPVIDAGTDSIRKWNSVMNTTNGQEWINSVNNQQQGNIRCNIAVSDWAPDVNEWVRADVIVEAKEGRARVTVMGLDKVVNGPGYKTCVSSIEKVVDARMANLKVLDNNW